VRTPDGLGTGFVVGDGSIVATNFHVIAGASEVIAEFADGTKVDFEGYLVASPGYDLAILKLPRPAGQPPLGLQTDRLDLGTDVFAIGSPRGLAGSVSKGRALAWAFARPRCNLFCGNPVEGVDSSGDNCRRSLKSPGSDYRRPTMPSRFIPPSLAFFILASLPVQAEEEAGSAQLPAAARRVLEDAEKAIARNRKAFDTANEESLNEAEKSLKQLLERLTKEAKLEEAIATKKLLGSFREQLSGLADDSPIQKATDASRRKPAANMPARRGKLECDEVFGFTDEKRVKEWWEFNDRAQNYQLGTDGVRLNNGGAMKLRFGLVGDFEFGAIVKQQEWHKPSTLSIAGTKLDIGDKDPGPTYRIAVTRKGNQLFVNANGKQSVLVVPETQADLPQYPSITCPGKLDVRSVGIKAVKVQRPED
jgi:hypothetical protein